MKMENESFLWNPFQANLVPGPNLLAMLGGPPSLCKSVSYVSWPYPHG